MLAALSVVDRIIKEHQLIMQDMQQLARRADDDHIVKNMNEAGAVLTPALLDDKPGLARLSGSLEALARELHQHFKFEETGLLYAIRQYGDRKLNAAFGELFVEHESLRNRFTRAKSEVSELLASDLPAEACAAKVKSAAEQLSYACQLIEKHARSEHELLKVLRSRLAK
ncbi:MAG: hemerythrin domain-containing protein [Chloroflexi bacterium]|nr:hemerythrin domain-containing protein [Chloroflexota bacterium]